MSESDSPDEGPPQPPPRTSQIQVREEKTVKKVLGEFEKWEKDKEEKESVLKQQRDKERQFKEIQRENNVDVWRKRFAENKAIQSLFDNNQPVEDDEEDPVFGFVNTDKPDFINHLEKRI